jgi:hypothetical protein
LFGLRPKSETERETKMKTSVSAKSSIAHLLSFSAFLLLTAGVTPSKAQILINGGFESPVLVAGGPGVYLSDPATNCLVENFGSDEVLPLPGWSVGTNVDVAIDRPAGSVYGASPAEGAQFLAFDPGDRPPGGNISQSFQTAPGQSYVLSFFVGGAGSGSGLSLDVSLYDGGDLSTPIVDQTFLPPISAGFGPLQILDFTAQSTLTELVFTDTSSPESTVNQDLLLDGVTVDVVPEPRTFTTLLCFGLGALALHGRNRRKLPLAAL